MKMGGDHHPPLPQPSSKIANKVMRIRHGVEVHHIRCRGFGEEPAIHFDGMGSIKIDPQHLIQQQPEDHMVDEMDRQGAPIPSYEHPVIPIDASELHSPTAIGRLLPVLFLFEDIEGEDFHGITHRDVTGRNIMIARDGRVVVLDFGLALPEGTTRLTETGSVVGTAAYVAPEVILGAPADARSDLYGLGVVLYEMLTGVRPFKGDRQDTILYAAVHDPPAPPSAHRAGVTLKTDRVVLRALAKDPGARYQTAAELIADLAPLESAALTALIAEVNALLCPTLGGGLPPTKTPLPVYE